MDYDEEGSHNRFGERSGIPKKNFSTSEYAQMPRRVSALLPPLVEELESEWKQTFALAQERLSSMEVAKVTRVRTQTDPGLVGGFLNLG